MPFFLIADAANSFHVFLWMKRVVFVCEPQRGIVQ